MVVFYTKFWSILRQGCGLHDYKPRKQQAVNKRNGKYFERLKHKKQNIRIKVKKTYIEMVAPLLLRTVLIETDRSFFQYIEESSFLANRNGVLQSLAVRTPQPIIEKALISVFPHHFPPFPFVVVQPILPIHRIGLLTMGLHPICGHPKW